MKSIQIGDSRNHESRHPTPQNQYPAMGCAPSLYPQHRVSDILIGDHDIRASMTAIRRIIHDRGVIYDLDTEKRLRAHINRMMSLATSKQYSEELLIELGHLFDSLYFRFPVAKLRLHSQCSAVLQQLYQRMITASLLDQCVGLSLKGKAGFLNTCSDLRGTMCTTEIKDIVVQGYFQHSIPTRTTEIQPTRHQPKSSNVSEDNGYGFYAALDE